MVAPGTVCVPWLLFEGLTELTVAHKKLQHSAKEDPGARSIDVFIIILNQHLHFLSIYLPNEVGFKLAPNPPF